MNIKQSIVKFTMLLGFCFFTVICWAQNNGKQVVAGITKSSYSAATNSDFEAAIGSGETLSQNGNYERAISAFYQALKIARQNDPHNIAFAHNKIGNVFNLLSNWDSAFRHYELALKYAEQYQHPDFRKSYVYNNLGTILAQQKQYEKALYYIERGIDDAQKNKDTLFLVTLLLNKGINQKFREQFDEALISFNQAKTIGVKKQLHDKVFKVLLNIGNMQ